MKKLLILLLLSGAAFLGFKKFQGNQVRQAWQEFTDSI